MFVFPESGVESMRLNNTPLGSRGSPAPGTEGGSSADLSSSLSQSTEDVAQDMVGYYSNIKFYTNKRIAWLCTWTNNISKNNWKQLKCDLMVLWLQSSVLLLVLSGAACTMEVKGENQVVAVEAQSLSPVQMGTVKVSDVLTGLVQGKLVIIN